MSEGLPVGWTARPVGEAGEVLLGRQRSPDQMTGQHPTPYLRVANVLDGHIDFSDVLTMNFTPTERAVYGLRPGDILLNEGQSLDLVGRSSIYDGPPDTYCYQNTLVRFRPKPGLRSRYAQAVFSRWVRQRTLTQIAKQTTSIAHLGASRFAALMFPEPPEQEQQRIAEILDALDRAIRASEQVIFKLEMLKRGLLHDLLTRGVDENGEIRAPDQTIGSVSSPRAGEYPTQWEVSRVASEFQITSGIALGPHRQPRRHPRPYLRVANVYTGRLDLSDVAHMEADAGEVVERALAPGDLLVVEGHANPGEIGRAAAATPEVKGYIFQNHLFRLRPMRLHSEFALACLNSFHARAYWRQTCATSSGLYTINRSQLERLAIPVPPVREQVQIVAHIAASDKRLQRERAQLNKLTLLKHGLTDDLLTGRVRVSPHPR